jgi:hypothetical protein
MQKSLLSYFIFLLVSLLSSVTIVAQNVGITTSETNPPPTPNTSAILDLNTGNSGKVGFLPPSAPLTFDTLWAPITGAAGNNNNGLMVYLPTADSTKVYAKGGGTAGLTQGYYYFNINNGPNGTWVRMGTKLAVPFFMQTEDPDYGNTYWSAYNVYNPSSGASNHSGNKHAYDDYGPMGTVSTTWDNGSPLSNFLSGGWWSSNFTASSYTVFNKFVAWVSDTNESSAIIKVWIVKYPLSYWSSANGAVLLAQNTITCTTQSAPYLMVIDGKQALLDPGDVVVVWSQVNNASTTVGYTIGGTLEFTTE